MGKFESQREHQTIIECGLWIVDCGLQQWNMHERNMLGVCATVDNQTVLASLLPYVTIPFTLSIAQGVGQDPQTAAKEQF